MHVLMVSSECAPLAKAGGLGDAVAGLARALGALGHRVEVLLPAYDCLRPAGLGPSQGLDIGLKVHFGGRAIDCRLQELPLEGYTCRLITPTPDDPFFSRGRIYGESDDGERFAFFACAALEYLRLMASTRRPDVLHCHDWQTGLLPALLKGAATPSTPGSIDLPLPAIPVCYTLHNIGYQGRFGPDLLDKIGCGPVSALARRWLADHTDPDRINLMKAGIAAADAVNTVSPRYAWEVLYTEQGMGLQTWLQRYAFKFAGILNGIDTAVWDPERDPVLPARFGLQTLERKSDNRRALCDRLGLAYDPRRPLIAVISRLDRQKGVELIVHGISYGLESGAQVALLGSALEPEIAARFESLRTQYADSPDARLVLGYDESLAHLIYAASDLILIPSLYEPCGLTQLIAMRYGTVPIARRVGGLADTIEDANDSIAPLERRTGFLFDEPTPEALADAMERAIWLGREYPAEFNRLRRNGMRMDWSWRQPARHYLELYRYAQQSCVRSERPVLGR